MRALVLAVAVSLLSATAAAQTEGDAGAGADAGSEPGAEGEPGSEPEPGAEGEPVPLPPPQLEDPDLPSEPAPEEPEEEPDGQTRLLLHIGGEPPPDPPPERGTVTNQVTDVPFVVPDDQRQIGGLSAAPRPEEEEPLEPPWFEIGAGAGWSRLLANMAIDYLWLEQRFELRIPDLPALRVGVGAAEHWRPEGLIFEIGPRIGYGVYIFDDRDVLMEAVIHVQPGFATGDLGSVFDLAAALDVRLQVPRWFELSASIGYALVGTSSILKLGGSLALTF